MCVAFHLHIGGFVHHNRNRLPTFVLEEIIAEPVNIHVADELFAVWVDEKLSSQSPFFFPVCLRSSILPVSVTLDTDRWM